MILRDDAATEALADHCRRVHASAASNYEAAQQTAKWMGAFAKGEVAEFGFWAPELLEMRIPDGDVFLEILQPDPQVSLTVSRQNARFRRTRVPVARTDAWVFCAVQGMRAGTREQIGYWKRIFDPMAVSVPFGVFAPAELYDMAAMQAARTDAAYFKAFEPGPDGAPTKLGPPRSMPSRS